MPLNSQQKATVSQLVAITNSDKKNAEKVMLTVSVDSFNDRMEH